MNKMLKVVVLKSVHQAPPWINSFLLGEGKDKFGSLKLRICSDPTNLNKAIVHEPYHFKTPEYIAHSLAEACVMTACACKKGLWHQQLDDASSFLAHDRMSVTSLCNHDLSVIVVVVIVGIVCEHSS